MLRRETERQVEMRQRSYAWQQKEEEAEPWTELRRSGPESREAASLRDAVMVATGDELPMTLGRQSYLDLLVPGASAEACATLTPSLIRSSCQARKPRALHRVRCHDAAVPGYKHGVMRPPAATCLLISANSYEPPACSHHRHSQSLNARDHMYGLSPSPSAAPPMAYQCSAKAS